MNTARRLLFGIALLVVPHLVSAQPPAPRSRTAPAPVRIRKLEGLGNRSSVETPQYGTSEGRGTKKAKEWQQITLTYDSYPDWIDELAIHFYVFSMGEDRSGPTTYSLYKSVVRYIDVERDQGHKATVFLRPTALLRYGEVVAVAAEIKVDGREVDVISETRPKPELPDQWWKNPRVVDSENVSVRNGYLLDRSKSPWAYVNIDDYEVIK